MTTHLTHHTTPISYQSGVFSESLDFPNGTVIPALLLDDDAVLKDLNLTLIEWFQLIYAEDKLFIPSPHLTKRFWGSVGEPKSFCDEITITISGANPNYDDEEIYLGVSVIIKNKFQLLGTCGEDFPDANSNKKFSYNSVKRIFEKLYGCKETMINTLIDTIQYDFDCKIDEMVEEILCDEDLDLYIKADQVFNENKRNDLAIEAAKKIKNQKNRKENIRLKLVAAEAEVKKFTSQMEDFP